MKVLGWLGVAVVVVFLLLALWFGAVVFVSNDPAHGIIGG